MRLHLLPLSLALTSIAATAEDLDPLGQKRVSLWDDELVALLESEIDGDVTSISAASIGGRHARALAGTAEIRVADGSSVKTVRFSQSRAGWSIDSVETRATP